MEHEVVPKITEWLSNKINCINACFLTGGNFSSVFVFMTKTKFSTNDRERQSICATHTVTSNYSANSEIVADSIRSLISLEVVGQYIGMVMKIKLISNIKCGIGLLQSA